MADFTPYTTVTPFFGQKPAWIPDALDQARIQSYGTYEQMYWNVPTVFKVAIRGTNNTPVYVPSARTIVETTNRYVGTKFGINVTSSTGDSGSQDVIAAQLALTDLMRREQFRTRYNGAKRYGLIWGDWLWHITADESKPAGRRITLRTLDPAMYFPIPDENDVNTVVGVRLAEPVTTEDGAGVHVQTYRKVPRPDGTNAITVEEGIFPVDSWQQPDAKPSRVIKPPVELPATITAIPVYHIGNFYEPHNPFGSSELRGLEIVMASINQVISDEDLALALDGIGMYATDAPQPIDPVTQQPTTWKLGPGIVAHHPTGNEFTRVNGVGSVTPYGDHYTRVWDALKAASGTPDIAIGSVDVSVAQSGIALALHLGPLLAKAGEKDDAILDIHNQMFFDLINGWFPAFEATTFTDVTVTCVVGEAVPVDREKRFAELNDMLDRHVIDSEYYRSEAAKLGYVFPSDIGTRVQVEQDQFAARAASDLTNGAQ